MSGYKVIAKTDCGDGPCSFKKPVCCLHCKDWKTCPERCTDNDCEIWKDAEAMIEHLERREHEDDEW